MRIVITNLGKTEIKDDDYNFPTENNNNHKTYRNISVQYNKIRNNNHLKDFKTSRKITSIPKIRYNKFPTMSKTSKNTINLLNDKINETFLPKINDSLKPNKSSITKRIFKKAIKVNQKKLNIPNVMFDKYISREALNNLFNKDEDIKINQTENNVFSERNKVYSLRDILLPKNQIKLDQSFLDKKLNTNGGKSIIDYLQKDKSISPFYIQKVTQLKNGELNKMDKICQKYLKDEIQKDKMDSVIRKKIKIGYEKEAIKYENDLKNMNNKLMNYNTIYQRLRLKKENYDNYKLMFLSTLK